MMVESVLPEYMEAGEGPVIFMIPGGEGAKEFWSPQLAAFSDRYRVIACDHPRFRLSRDRSMADYSDAFARLLDELGIEQAIMVGESFGGMVLQEFACRYHERMAGLILINTVDKRNRFGFGFNMFTLATLVHNLAFLPFLSDATRRRILNWVGKHRGFVMDPTPGNEMLIDYIVKYGTACGVSGYVDRAVAGSTARGNEVLRTIGVPTLVLRGTEDRLVHPFAPLSIAGRIPRAELKLIEGGGHCCSLTMPEETNRHIADWLSRTGL